MMDDDPQVRGEICRGLVGEGARQIHASDAAKAVAELHSAQTASLLLMDGEGEQPAADIYRHLLSDDPFLAQTAVVAVFDSGQHRPGVRAAASLPQSGTDDRLFTALERAAASHLTPVLVSDAQAI